MDSQNSAPVQQGNEQPVPATPPSKKRRLRLLDDGQERYDASNLVPRFTSVEDVPEHLQKYFAQRNRYFSLYDRGCLLDEEGWYSVTPEKIAEQIAERCRCDTILDAFCGVGGNAIAFAKTCHRVIALDNSPTRLALARHNAAIYGVQDRIEFVLADYLDFARTYAKRPPEKRSIDVVFLSPPWGGPSYLTDSPQKEKTEADVLQSFYSLQLIRPVPGDELFLCTRQITGNVAYFLPRNVDLEEVSGLLRRTSAGELVEVEEEYMGGKLKAVTCYFGGLVAGQESLF
ncbi:S-adenosyl-L-methionine-dependent methyltransferase [Fomitiporia mediterranea MF3/22]|uniref:S-adenosyl-L-methionine-dependent methyltransferase n=1 Tax=Fomitiporia mediterranea (strain MF3/22) TaxID=694068 RepID=UPI00044078A3|nr:S-adenosyl-L-methionine-dependent methyltransferase [Fomitiporia mediterranea MF3/22]EJC99718.1 S-adenosyl-L-methionine-dependent methyltransferase [Fomitiporia mediterranea MF3/22]